MSSTTATSSSTTSSTTTFQTGVQYGFFFDQGRCIDCKTCTIACKNWYNVDPGPEKWCRTFEWESGTFPNVTLNSLFAPCYHCANPVCIAAANGAMFKEPNYGAVLIDPSQASSANLRAAWNACPYGAIVFDSDSPTANASKCTMCIDRLEEGKSPICVLSCPMRALDFGPMDTLIAKYGSNKDLDGVPSSSTTNPSIIFKPRIDHTSLVPYDANSAATLMASRGTLPPLYTDPSDLIPNTGVVGRSSLNIKPSSSAELMQATQNDEG